MVLPSSDYRDAPPTVSDPAFEAKFPACAARNSYLREHLLRVNSGSTSGTAVSAELYDSADQAKLNPDMIKACDLEQGYCYWKPIKNFTQDGAEVTLRQYASIGGDKDVDCVGVMGQSAMVRVDNVDFFMQRVGDVEPDLPGFVSAAVAELKAVAGR